VKIDSLGNKQWDKRLGGTGDDRISYILQTEDGGYIFGANSSSDVSGDKTQPLKGGAGDTDFWIVKTDSLGNMQWDRDYGGTMQEWYFTQLSRTSDSGYVFGGSSRSPAGGDKTQNNMSDYDAWIVKINSSGNKVWDKTLLTNANCWGFEPGIPIETKDHGLAVAVFTCGGVGGDKTQPNRDAATASTDYWVVKCRDQSQPPVIDFASSDTEICAYDCIRFYDYTSNATSYAWSFPGGTPSTSTVKDPQNICYLTDGTYDVTLVASNAFRFDTVTYSHYITVIPSPPTPAITRVDSMLYCNADSSYVSYQWYIDTTRIIGATDTSLVINSSGNYHVEVTNAQGCKVATGINIIYGLQNYLGNHSISLYPDPAGSELRIKNSELRIEKAEIYNTLGQQCLQSEIKTPQSEISLDVSGLPAGIYFLQLKTEKGRVVRKFIKE